MEAYGKHKIMELHGIIFQIIFLKVLQSVQYQFIKKIQMYFMLELVLMEFDQMLLSERAYINLKMQVKHGKMLDYEIQVL